MTTRPGYIWSGTEWVSIGQEAVVAPVKYQTTAPTSPSTGDIWIDSDDDVPGIDTSQFLRWRKTAAGGETSVSGTDDNGLTLQYTANYEQVYLNGVLLVRGQDYTATNGTSITGLTALAANDVVEVFGVVARVVGDVYTQAQTNSLLDAKSNVSSTGLVLITSATIGSAVSSVTVSNCFSSTYDNYRIKIAGTTGSTSASLKMQLGSATSGCYSSVSTQGHGGTTVSNFGTSNTAYIEYIGGGSSDGVMADVELHNPFLTMRTFTYGIYQDSLNYGRSLGLQASATSFTGFTIVPSSGTITGGTIKVYGYK